MFRNYRDLNAYKLAYALALEIHKESLNLPKIEQFGGMADQLRRASKSICANMAEGLSKITSPEEECRFLGMARGSCEECCVWVQFWIDLGYIPPERGAAWQDTLDQVSKMLFALIQKRRKV